MERKLLFKLVFVFTLLFIPLSSVFADEQQKTQVVETPGDLQTELVAGIPVVGGVGAAIAVYNKKRKQKTKNKPVKTIPPKGND